MQMRFVEFESVTIPALAHKVSVNVEYIVAIEEEISAAGVRSSSIVTATNRYSLAETYEQVIAAVKTVVNL